MCSNPWLYHLAHQHGSLCSSAASWQGRQPLQRCHSAPIKATTAAGVQQPMLPTSTEKQCPRFYTPQLPSCIGAAVDLEPEEAKHAVRVLRLKQGDTLELCDGSGGLVQCEVQYTDRNSATVVATSGPCLSPWQGPKWVVAAACLTLKGGRADWLVEKATELGAFALLPLVTERSHTGTTKSKFKSLSSKGSKAAAAEECPEDFQPSRLQRLALAATKQSLRAHALQLLPVTALSDLLPQLQQSPVSLVATAGAPPALHVLQEAAQQWQQSQQQPGCGAGALWQGPPCYLLIGPEGDFTSAEVHSLAGAGVLPVGLGNNRLRTETAAMALLAAATLYSDAATIHAGESRSTNRQL